MACSSNSRLEDVIKTIRSCLITHKGPVSIQELKNDYRSFEDENIPFREFNFKTLSDFLRSLKNDLRFIERDGEVLLRVIESERSRHISALVAGQKPAKKSKKRQSNGHNYKNVSFTFYNACNYILINFTSLNNNYCNKM